MTEIYALVMFLYYPNQRALDHYQFNRDWIFQTAEQCEQLKQKTRDILPQDGDGVAGIKYICVHKTISTWKE
jgi:hypothetical protein